MILSMMGGFLFSICGAPLELGEVAEFEQTGIVTQLRFVPGTDLFVSGARFGGVHLRDLRDPTKNVVLAEDAVAVDVSEDGQWIVVGTVDGIVLLYELPELTLRREWRGRRGSIVSVAIARGGTLIAAAQGPTVISGKLEYLESYEIWLVEATSDRMNVAVRNLPNPAMFLDLDAAGTTLAFVIPGAFGVWSVTTDKYVIEPKTFVRARSGFPPENFVTPITISADSKSFATDSYLLRLDDGSKLKEFSDPEAVVDWPPRGIDLSDNGKRFAAGFPEGMAKVWDVETGELIFKRQVLRSKAEVQAVALNADGTRLLTGGFDAVAPFTPLPPGTPRKDPYIRLWKLP